MSRRLALVAVLVLTASLYSAPRAAGKGAQPGVVLAAPSEGHPGGVIYLSGGGFPPKRQLAIRLTCKSSVPALPAPTFAIQRGPVTDAHGQFTAYRFQAPRVRTARAMDCLIGASLNPAKPAFGNTFPAVYRVFPASQRLAACATRICVTVSALLVRLRTGVWGTVAVRAWPGASADVQVAAPPAHLKAMMMHLSWQGTGTVRLRVASGLKQALSARVQVHVQLGSAAGTGTARFAVVPGGR
jgi:hypothetical protein